MMMLAEQEAGWVRDIIAGHSVNCAPLHQSLLGVAKMQKNSITKDQVLSLLSYDDATGHLIWLSNVGGRLRKGTRAGRVAATGYREVGLYGHLYLEHRIIWLIFNGSFPKDQIDHINRVKDDNRIENLRECNTSENHQNLTLVCTNTSGVVGVTWNKRYAKWQAQIGLHKKNIFLGLFDTIDDAAKARREAELKYHTLVNGTANG